MGVRDEKRQIPLELSGCLSVPYLNYNIIILSVKPLKEFALEGCATPCPKDSDLQPMPFGLSLKQLEHRELGFPRPMQL